MKKTEMQETNTSKLLQAQENLCKQVAMGSLTFNLLTK